MDLFQGTNHESGAIFSQCRKYRYVLWRIWDDLKPKLLFIGLNPSTGNELEDDPTIRRIKKFANNWGYGGVYLMNLYAYITPNPKDLFKQTDLQKDNFKHMLHYSKLSNNILLAYGNFKLPNSQPIDIIKYYMKHKNIFILGTNKNGTPKHPLYISGNTQPIKIYLT